MDTSASMVDIRHAYRKLAGKWHPDKWSSCGKAEQDTAAQRFAQIAEAYAKLSQQMMIKMQHIF